MADGEIFDVIAKLRETGAPFAVATVVRTADVTSAKAGAKAAIDRSGAIHGFLGGGCVQGAVRQAALEAIGDGKVRVIRVRPAAKVVTRIDADGAELYKSGCPSGGTVELLIEPYRRAPFLAILGASPVALALGRLAKPMGYRLVHGARADDLGAIETDLLAADFKLEEVALDADDWVVVAAQGKGDLDALRQALSSPARYVAMVASRKKASALTEKLREEGMAVERIARLKAPAGLDLRAVDPEEIAVSILAEIVAERRAAGTALSNARASLP